MNMTGDGDDNPEALPPGMPLSAPVAADMVLERPSVRFHEQERYPRPSVAYPPVPRQSPAAFSRVMPPPAVPDRPVAPGGHVVAEPPGRPPAAQPEAIQPEAASLAAGVPYAQPATAPAAPSPATDSEAEPQTAEPQRAVPQKTVPQKAAPQPVPAQPDSPAASQPEPASTPGPDEAGAGKQEFAQTSPVHADFHPRGGAVEDPPDVHLSP
jgi:hypothetical protein